MSEESEKNALARAIDDRDISSTVYRLKNLIPLLRRRALDKESIGAGMTEKAMWNQLEAAFNEDRLETVYIYASDIQRNMRLQNK